VREKARWLTRMLRLDEATPRSTSDAGRYDEAKRQWARRQALLVAADCYMTREDADLSAACLDEALLLSRAAGDRAAEFWALYLRIPLLLYNRDESSAHAEAGRIVRQLIATVRTLENDHVKTDILTYIGWHLICLPDGRAANHAHLAEAIALTEEGISLARRRGDPLNEFTGAGIKAGLCTYADDMLAARAAVSRSLELVVEAGYECSMGNPTLNALAGMAAHEGRGARAARLLGAQRALEEVAGYVSMTDTAEILTTPLESQAYVALGDERWNAHYAAGKAMSREEVIAEAWREARGEPENTAGD
jgi:tetratricopeptide (TPR) repeat protein